MKNNKPIRHSILCAAMALATIYLLLLILTSSNVSAHAPSGVELAYDFEKQTLLVTMTHSVADPNTHYIRSVEIKKNSQAISLQNYTNQPTSSPFTYTYSIPAADGDVVEATATCSIAGSRTGTVTVLAQALPTITIEVPATGATINSAQTTVSGKTTGDLASGKVELAVNDGPWLEAIGTDSWSLQVTLVEGENTIDARVTDSKGNMAQAKVVVTSKPFVPPPEPQKGEIDSPGFELALALLGLVCLSALPGLKLGTKRR